MRKRLCGLAAGALLLVGQWSAAAFSIPDGYTQNRLIMASEPGAADSDYVAYYQNDQKQPLEQIDWTDGRKDHGKAISLSGKGDYLAVGYDQLRLTDFSISLWVNWKGAVDGQSADQRLVSIVQDTDNYIALSTFHQTDTPNNQGQIANGLFLDVTINGEQETAFKPSTPPVQTTLPQNEWHHVALVAHQPYLSLYIDGTLWAQTMWGIGLRELNPNYLRIGGGETGTNSLYALIDDVEIYADALTNDQLLMLAAGVDPLAAGATVPSQTTAAPVTRPTTSTQEGADLDDTGKDVSLQVALTVGGCGLGVFVLLTIGSLIFGKKPPADPSAKTGGTPS